MPFESIGHDLSEIAGVVVDNFISSDVAQIGLVCRTRGRDHMGTDMFGKLNGEAGDPARSALDQDPLPGLQFQHILDGTHCGETGERQAAALTYDSPSGFLATMTALTAIFSA